MARLEVEVDINTDKMEEFVYLAQGVAKKQLKKSISEYIKLKEAEYYRISQDSMMHFSAHDIFLILQDINEHIRKL